MIDREIELLLRQIDQAYDRKSWHGRNLKGALRGLGALEAAWRPAPGRHSIWELIVHCAYWKYAATRRLAGGERGSFPLAGSDFFARPAGGIEPGSEAAERAFRTDLRLLGETHAALRAAVEKVRARDLFENPPGSKVTRFYLISGVAAHDLYHAGQIQLLKRLRSAATD